jgi:CheY-like chemotaxis protein
MNLVSNARDASPEGGMLRIETAAVELAPPAGGSVAAGKFARLAVVDHGVGMSPEVARHAFDPFFTTKEVGRGTGLGLSTCHTIVAQSHGTIEIESAPNRGTTVLVHLPLAAASGPVRPEQSSVTVPGPARPGERILVVEDDPSVRRMIVDSLRRRGYDVVEATDGLEGADAYAADPSAIDLVVSDVIMPRAGGPRMLTLLADRGHRPPVLFLSGYAIDALLELRRTGARVDLLEKPFTADRLAARVRQILDAAPRQQPDT